MNPKDDAVASATGLRVARQIVEEHWACKWNIVEQINDNGFDAFAYFQRKGKISGNIIFVQVKSGRGYLKEFKEKYQGYFGINLGKDYIESHKPRWLKAPGPAILIYVDPTTDKNTPKAWWIDLKSSGIYANDNSNILLIPLEQYFNGKAKSSVKRLDRLPFASVENPHLNIDSRFFNHLRLNAPIKRESKKYYRELSTSTIRSPVLGNVVFSRVGWRHISRSKREISRIINSMSLLPAAKACIEKSRKIDFLGRASKRTVGEWEKVKDFIGIRTIVEFPFRDSALIQVILLRVRMLHIKDGSTQTKIWFYSVYEKRRK